MKSVYLPSLWLFLVSLCLLCSTAGQWTTKWKKKKKKRGPEGWATSQWCESFIYSTWALKRHSLAFWACFCFMPQHFPCQMVSFQNECGVMKASFFFIPLVMFVFGCVLFFFLIHPQFVIRTKMWARSRAHSNIVRWLFLALLRVAPDSWGKRRGSTEWMNFLKCLFACWTYMLDLPYSVSAIL